MYNTPQADAARAQHLAVLEETANQRNPFVPQLRNEDRILLEELIESQYMLDQCLELFGLPVDTTLSTQDSFRLLQAKIIEVVEAKLDDILGE